MDWILANWFWILIAVLFIGLHLFGHGGGHQHGSKNTKDDSTDDTQARTGNTSAGGHQH